MAKNVCTLPRTPAFHPSREYPKIRLLFLKKKQKTLTTEAKSASVVASET